MNVKFVDYIKDIGITDKSIISRIESIQELFSYLSPEKITDIFVSETLDEDGNRRFVGLDCYSTKYLLSARNFTNEDNFSLVFYRKQFRGYDLEMDEYNFNTATDESKLKVTCYQKDSSEKWYENALGKNCDYLKKIVFKYIIPNIIDEG
jgi:hypothetical protein